MRISIPDFGDGSGIFLQSVLIETIAEEQLLKLYNKENNEHNKKMEDVSYGGCIKREKSSDFNGRRL